MISGAPSPPKIPKINAAKMIAKATFLFCTISCQVFSGVNFSKITYPNSKMIIPKNKNEKGEIKMKKKTKLNSQDSDSEEEDNDDYDC